MFRRFVNLVLLPCVLLPQWAAVPHSHGADTPVGHDDHAHFHVVHSHGHQHHHHHHHGHPHGVNEEAGLDDVAPDSQPLPHDGHDADAIFVPLVDAIGAQRTVVADGDHGGWCRWIQARDFSKITLQDF